jgi:AcrR family transcriptional regulator
VPVARWEPDARGRLEKAALELFQERGYAQTTVGDIAERAGLTERTFFRYFVDKREVLFSGSQLLEKAVVEAVEAAPVDAAPLEIVSVAFQAVGAALQAQRDLGYIRTRYAIVREQAEVRERELIKMASLASSVTNALRARGVAEPEASLVAEAGVTVFKVGFERWITAKKPGEFAAHIREAVEALKTVTAGSAPAARASQRASSNGKRGSTSRR